MLSNEDLKILSKKYFSGSSPPEIFVGRNNYPNVQAGILAPVRVGNTEILSSPEYWFKKQASIEDVISYRNSLIYSKFKLNIKTPSQTISNPLGNETDKLLNTMNLVAMSSKSLSMEFKLKNLPQIREIKEPNLPIIGNPAELTSVKLEENPVIPKKIDYITSDNKLKASDGIKNLYSSKIQTSNIIKILSAGLLGLKTQRKMVPTRWAVTAVDDTLSKTMLDKIKEFQEINEFQVFSGEYVGNHYEILLLPDKFSFEVIEISHLNNGVWQDYESFFGRKTYAESVTGAYYSNRLALTEHFLKIKRQASCIFFREIKPEYNAPLGVGILRELSRNCLQKKPETFQKLSEALNYIENKIQIPFSTYKEKSIILREHGKQKRLSQWFN